MAMSRRTAFMQGMQQRGNTYQLGELTTLTAAEVKQHYTLFHSPRT
jgi:hypothetical protein